MNVINEHYSHSFPEPEMPEPDYPLPEIETELEQEIGAEAR